MKRLSAIGAIALLMATSILVPLSAQKGAASGSPYYFKFAYGMWDLSRGRISVEEQRKSPYFQYVAQKTGAAPLTVSWEWDGSEGYVRGLRLMLASGDIPEALKPYNMQLTAELIEEGVAVPLDDFLAKQGKDIYAQLSKEEWDAVRAQSSDGKIYYIPEINAIDRSPASFVRKDWLDRVGMQVPKTRDELVAMYRAFKTKDADGNGKIGDEIPVSGRNGMRWLDDIFMMHGVAMFEGYPQWTWDPKSQQLMSEQISPAMKMSIEFLNYLYKEKLIDDVFMIQSAADWIAKINTGRVGHYFHLPSQLEVFSGFMAQDPKAKWVYMPPVKVPGIDQQKFTFQRAAVPGFMITKAAKDPGKIMEWYNWSQTDDGSLYNSLGIPDLDWKRNAAGKIEILRKDAKPFYSYVPVVTKYIPDATRFTPVGEDKVTIINQARNYIKFGPDNLGMPDKVYEGYEDFNPQTAKLYREWATKMVIGEISLSQWDDYVKAWNKAGGAEVTKRATAWYKKMKGIK